MIESLRLIQCEIEYVLSQTSRNDPNRNHLKLIIKECDKLIDYNCR